MVLNGVQWPGRPKLGLTSYILSCDTLSVPHNIQELGVCMECGQTLVCGQLVLSIKYCPTWRLGILRWGVLLRKNMGSCRLSQKNGAQFKDCLSTKR